MIHVGHNDFVALAERLSNRETYQANERGGVHPKCNLAGITRVQEIRDTLARAGNRRIDFLALRVAPTALDVAIEEMVVDCIDHKLWNLSARGIVEEGECRGAMKRREGRTNFIDWKIRVWLSEDFLPEDTLRFGLQVLLLIETENAERKACETNKANAIPRLRRLSRECFLPDFRVRSLEYAARVLAKKKDSPHV
jgi:hypothetical protein